MRKTSTEMEIKVSNGRITSAEVLKDGTCKITVEMNTEGANANDVFVLCEASKLSLDDEFMKHTPCSDEERTFKKLLEEAIKSGLKDFYRPVFDPSLDKAENICYVSDAKPAVGKSYNWWKETAKQFCPERGSRLGTKKEYIAFLGILIKKLSKSGWSVAEAWNAVCNDSKELGHYRNSPNAKHKFETTNSRKVCGFYDLANTYKILSEDEEAGGFWLAGGYYGNSSNYVPLADLNHYCNCHFGNDYGVGWLVLEK